MKARGKGLCPEIQEVNDPKNNTKRHTQTSNS